MDKKIEFYKNYIEEFSNILTQIEPDQFKESIKFVEHCNRNGGKLIIVGNGGSASISSHVAVDFTKACGIRSINFNEPNLLTCFSNDFGYENWVSEALKAYSDPNDLVILISSSGTSPNILNAADFCIEHELNLITFSGFSEKNILKKKGQINFWVNSNSYNFIEMAHHVWLVCMVDYLSSVEK